MTTLDRRLPSLGVAVIFVLACTSTALARGADLAVTGATLIDGTGAPPQGNVTIVVRDGRIAAITPDSGADVPEGIRILDAEGKYLIPGLADMHVHFSSGGLERRDSLTTERVLQQFLFYGVTSVLNVGATGGSPEEIVRVRMQQVSGAMPGPRVYATGNMLTQPGSHPIATIMEVPEGTDPETYDWTRRGVAVVETPDEARMAVRHNSEPGMDGIKIIIEAGNAFLGEPYPQMPPEMIRAVVDEAGDLPVFAHVSSLDELEAALENGVHAIVHSVVHPPFPDSKHWAVMRERDIFHVPTLAVYEGLLSDRWAGHAALEDAFVREGVYPGTIESIKGWSHSAWETPSAVRSSHRNGILQSVKAAHDAGVKLALGTDTGNPFVFPGHSAHMELELMVEAGLTPMEAIVAATRHPAQMLGEEADFGTIEPGMRADLILLDANPLEDISNTQQIHAVIANGQLYRRADLDSDRMLQIYDEDLLYYWRARPVTFEQFEGSLYEHIIPNESYSIEMVDPHVQMLGSNTAVAVINGRDKAHPGEEAPSLRAGASVIFDLRGGKWNIVDIHQSEVTRQRANLRPE